jgi:hypothetical protein
MECLFSWWAIQCCSRWLYYHSIYPTYILKCLRWCEDVYTTICNIKWCVTNGLLVNLSVTVQLYKAHLRSLAPNCLLFSVDENVTVQLYKAHLSPLAPALTWDSSPPSSAGYQISDSTSAFLVHYKLKGQILPPPLLFIINWKDRFYLLHSPTLSFFHWVHLAIFSSPTLTEGSMAPRDEEGDVNKESAADFYIYFCKI